MKLIIFFAFMTMVSTPVIANESVYSKNFNECMSSAEGVTLAMRACYADESATQDKRLNLNYKRYIAKLSPETKNNFVNAQRLWIKFRDENCSAFSSQEEGGTLSSIVGDSCYLKMTTERADDFK
ncbi:lysozyme inhibitor LprI family protein [Pantoea sp. CCBC3-3-1]|uniref:lysozyme inhibitor LprI family protein n=1 Tax=Pantoea sp. CCBC3-3-1 TaxID=2490851 RepID=UPI0011BD7D2C|nr:lysozyme inhibitor LprI family protein [Pantoea sp. CCBC3-3-1]